MAHFAVVVSDVASQAAHGAMQGRFGTAKNALGITPVHRVPRHANARIQKQVTAIDKKRRFNGFLHEFRQLANF